MVPKWLPHENRRTEDATNEVVYPNSSKCGSSAKKARQEFRVF